MATVGSGQATAAINAWLEIFVQAAAAAVEQSERLIIQIEKFRADWKERSSAHRTSLGLRSVPRAGSAGARLIAGNLALHEIPGGRASPSSRP